MRGVTRGFALCKEFGMRRKQGAEAERMSITDGDHDEKERDLQGQ
jgi:hypothetical protein